MSIHTIFAANLRLKTLEHGTIADACRDIGINRQQFNKYLAGASLPNAVTLRNICNVLDIQEQSLFAAELPEVESRRVTSRPAPLQFGFPQLQKKGFDFIVSDLVPGYYYCIFPLPNVAGMLVKSLVLVTHSSKQKEFVRLTRLQIPGGSKRPLLAGRHSGIICANASEIYFFGINRQHPNQISMLVFERREGATDGIYRGTALTQNFNASINPKACLFFVEQQNDPRYLIKNIGIIHESDRSVDPAILATLHSN